MKVNSVNPVAFKGTLHIGRNAGRVMFAHFRDLTGQYLEEQEYKEGMEILNYNDTYDTVDVKVDTNYVTNLYSFDGIQGITFFVLDLNLYTDLHFINGKANIVEGYTAACQNKHVNVEV